LCACRVTCFHLQSTDIQCSWLQPLSVDACVREQ
jgi:hypothetical protein